MEENIPESFYHSSNRLSEYCWSTIRCCQQNILAIARWRLPSSVNFSFPVLPITEAATTVATTTTAATTKTKDSNSSNNNKSLKKSIEIWNHFSRKIFFWRTKFCCNFFPFLSSIATLIHFPGVTNAFGPSNQPTACRSPTLSLMTATGNNQAQGKVYTYLVVLILIILIIFYLAKLINQWSML